MIFLTWSRPTNQDERSCINKSGVFNYDSKFKGATAKPVFDLKQDKELSDSGFSINHARTYVGSGLETFEKGKTALQNWRQFGLNWTFVDPKTRIESGVKFGVGVKVIRPWILMPLEVVYIDESRNSGNATASYSFGSGTLQGHMLAGEKCFSITMDEKRDVWYEILSFSKPVNFLALIGYPFLRLSQKRFTRESTLAMQQYLSANVTI